MQWLFRSNSLRDANNINYFENIFQISEAAVKCGIPIVDPPPPQTTTNQDEGKRDDQITEPDTKQEEQKDEPKEEPKEEPEEEPKEDAKEEGSDL